MKEALILLGSTVHQLQKERGRIALFLGGKHLQPSLEMVQQFKNTDSTVIALKEAHQRWKKNRQIRDTGKLNYRLTQLDELPQQRIKISNSDYPTYKASHYYTYEIIAPLLEIMVEIALFDSLNDPNKVSAYSNFLQWKERIGRERAIGALNLARSQLSHSAFLSELKTLISEQESYQQTFFALANSRQKTCLENTLNTTLPSEHIESLNKLHQVLENSDKNSQLPSLTAADWFTLLTFKIDSLYQAEQLLVDTLKKNNHEIDDKTDEEAITNKITTDRELLYSNSDYNYIDLIKTLSFFSDLPENLLNQLLQSANTREYKKGKILFLEGEQPTRFYIILRGWVRLYKGNMTGEETILQMLSCGDSIVESAVFLNAPYPLGAQIAENATLLSFPAPMIRQLVRSNNKLAVNMLTNISQRSQFLIQEVETTRLKSASERVGWFLLKTLISQNERNNHVKLPYDKAMIASYLDMKPETFSRTLKRFKDQGFHIDNDTIMLPGISALCGYCDMDIAPTCSRHNTKNCPHSSCTN